MIKVNRFILHEASIVTTPYGNGGFATGYSYETIYKVTQSDRMWFKYRLRSE